MESQAGSAGRLRPRPASPFDLLRLVAAAAGVALLVVGAIATFETDNGPGSAALVAAGVAFAALGLLGDRIQQLRFGGVDVILREIGRLHSDADARERAGDLQGARERRARAEVLAELIRPAAER
jgi:hypothetical protein